jgi:hypothetical protein
MGWSFVVAKKLGIRVASFWPASAACLAIMLKIPKLIEDGVLNDKGTQHGNSILRSNPICFCVVNWEWFLFCFTGWPEREEMLQLAPGMPPLHTSLLSWNNSGAPEGQHIIFDLVCRNNKLNDLAEIVVCNSFQEAEAGAFKLFPNILPIGPLFADSKFQKPVGSFLREDERCLKWLDARPDGSVVYVAFGSMAIFDPRQFQELAEGLELTGRPFLWVVRPDFTAGLSKEWLDDFRQRVAGAGMIVSWCSQQQVRPKLTSHAHAPTHLSQQNKSLTCMRRRTLTYCISTWFRQVLAHRAVACFVSHCGWNSTMEAVRNGVPVLCWPYFSDQFLNRSYVADVWRTGLAVSPGEDGVMTKEEVKSKVEKVIGDEGIRKRAMCLKDAASKCISKGGSSHKNFMVFVDLLSQ